ncbi:MAG: nicotinate-nucleotide--dimethylbenzimidazole phosphoribosyltransferase [Caldimonas sp.]
MSTSRPVVAPIVNPLLDEALRQKLKRRGEVTGSLGELEPLAVKLGLIQNTLKPAFHAPQMVVFAADHGLAVDGVGTEAARSTAQLVSMLLTVRLPIAVFSRIQGLQLSVVDSGVAELIPPHARLLARKIAHGTRSARTGPAMSVDHAEAGLRAGIEIGRSLPGNAVACAGIGVGSNESAALVMSRLTGCDVAQLVPERAPLAVADREHSLSVLKVALARQKDPIEPLAVLAAFGGFEMAMMVGLMLMASSERHLIVVDGMPACAALLIASRLSPAVADYCVYSRSHGGKGLDEALALLNAEALLEMGINSIDGTGATLAWPLIRSAAALLTEVADGEDPGPTLPAPLN